MSKYVGEVVIDKIDFMLLREQRLDLFKAIDEFERQADKASKSEADVLKRITNSLDGIQNLLEDIAFYGADVLGYPKKEILLCDDEEE